MISAQNIETAHLTLKCRDKSVVRLRIATNPAGANEGRLGVTLQGSYQDEEFIDKVRPAIVQVILTEIEGYDRQLRQLGVEPPKLDDDLQVRLSKLGVS